MQRWEKVFWTPRVIVKRCIAQGIVCTCLEWLELSAWRSSTGSTPFNHNKWDCIKFQGCPKNFVSPVFLWMCTWDVWVLQSSGDFPLIHLQLQGIHFIYIPWNPEGPWRRGRLFEHICTFKIYFHHNFHWNVMKFWAFRLLASSPVCIITFLFESFYMTWRRSLSLSFTWKSPPFDLHWDPKLLPTGEFEPREVGYPDIVLSGAPSPLPRMNQTLREWKWHSWHAVSPLDKASVNPGDKTDDPYIYNSSFTISTTSRMKMKTYVVFWCKSQTICPS